MKMNPDITSYVGTLLSRPNTVALVDSNELFNVTKAFTGTAFFWNPSWEQELGTDGTTYRKLHAERYSNQEIERVVYILSGGNFQPHDKLPQYHRLPAFRKFLSKLWMENPAIRKDIEAKMEVYVALSMPTNITFALGKTAIHEQGLAMISTNCSPLPVSTWPRVSFATVENSVVTALQSFFNAAISPRYGKRINLQKFLTRSQTGEHWHASVDESVETKVLIVNNAQPKERAYVDPIEQFLLYLAHTKHYFLRYEIIEHSELGTDRIRGYDAIILSASPFGNDIVDHHMTYYDWLTSCNTPVFGICAGHQIIGRHFGSELLRGAEAEEGLTHVWIEHDDPLFRGEPIPPTFQQHRDSVTCPKDFITLARSDGCKNQIMKHKTQPIYSTQFHAEANNRWLLESFISLAEDYRYGLSITTPL